MISMPEDLPDDPVLLKQMLAQLLMERTVDKGQIVDLKEQVKLLRDRLFSCKSCLLYTSDAADDLLTV